MNLRATNSIKISRMSRKPTARRSDSVYSADAYYQTLRRIQHAALAVLDNVEALLDAAERYKRKTGRVHELFHVHPEEGPTCVYRIAPRPADQLIADYVAYLETEFWPDIDGPTLDFVEELVTGRRASVVALSGQWFASAVRAVRMLSEAPIPIPEDLFNIEPLTGYLRWEVIAKRSDLGVVTDPDAEWPRLTVHRSLQRGYSDLAFALVCGFGRHEVPPASWLSERHRLLARLIAEDDQVTKLVRGVRAKVLAQFLVDMASSKDLRRIREELWLECAAVTSRLPEFRAHVAALLDLSNASRQKKRRKPNAPDPRRAYAYELVCNEKLPLKEGLRLFKARAEKEGWDSVETIQGLRDMAAGYAQDFDKPRPPARYGK